MLSCLSGRGFSCWKYWDSLLTAIPWEEWSPGQSDQHAGRHGQQLFSADQAHGRPSQDSAVPGDRHRSTSSSSQGESGGQQGWQTKAALVSSLPSPGDRAERNSGLWLGARHSWIQASEKGTFAGVWTSLTFSFNIESAARCQVGEGAFLARPYTPPSGWGWHLRPSVAQGAVLNENTAVQVVFQTAAQC